jgi:hypothetical protein
MWLKIKILFTSALVFIGLGSLSPKNNINCNKAIEPSISPEDTIKGPYTKKGIHDRLVTLSKNPIPKNLRMGAMCYDISGPPDRTEYICPKCNEKTIYASDLAEFVYIDIQACRSYMKYFKGINAKLDESQFCKKCSPDVKKPELCFEILYDDEKKLHISCGITNIDMQLVSEFLSGSKIHSTFNGSEEPLKDYVNRLEKLLDIKITDK